MRTRQCLQRGPENLGSGLNATGLLDAQEPRAVLGFFESVGKLCVYDPYPWMLHSAVAVQYYLLNGRPPGNVGPQCKASVSRCFMFWEEAPKMPPPKSPNTSFPEGPFRPLCCFLWSSMARSTCPR